MLLGRESEFLYLHQFIKKQGNQLLIVYGQKNVGKTITAWKSDGE